MIIDASFCSYAFGLDCYQISSSDLIRPLPIPKTRYHLETLTSTCAKPSISLSPCRRVLLEMFILFLFVIQLALGSAVTNGNRGEIFCCVLGGYMAVLGLVVGPGQKFSMHAEHIFW